MAASRVGRFADVSPRRDVVVNLGNKRVERAIGRTPGLEAPPSQSITVDLNTPGDVRLDAPPGATTVDVSYGLLVSTSNDRSDPVALDGYTAEGDIYVFTSPDTDVDEVDFYIDDQFERTDTSPPFDLVENDPGFPEAFPYDTTQLSNGQHEVRAELDTGVGLYTATGSFLVANDIAPPSGVEVNPSNFASRVSSNPAGTTFLLANGEYGPAALPVKSGNTYFGQGSSVVFTGPGASGSPFYSGSHDDVSLYNLRVERYGPNSAHRTMLSSEGAHGWLLDGCTFRYTSNTLVRIGNNWTVRDCLMQYAGEYAMAGSGNDFYLENTRWWDIATGAGGIPDISGSDKGGNKFVLAQRHHINGLDARRSYHGIWYDISNSDVLIENSYFDEIDMSGIDLEISYGPMTVRNCLVERSGFGSRQNEANWGSQAGIGISLTPDVYVYNCTVRDNFRGICCVQWNHPVLRDDSYSVYRTVRDNGINRFGSPGQYYLGLDDVLIENCTVTNMVNNTRFPGHIPYAAGRFGSYQRWGPNDEPTRGATQNSQTIWRNCNFDPDALFGSGSFQ